MSDQRKGRPRAFFRCWRDIQGQVDPLPPSASKVLLALYFRAGFRPGEAGLAEFWIDQFAPTLKMSRKTLRRAIQTLVDSGLIEFQLSCNDAHPSRILIVDFPGGRTAAAPMINELKQGHDVHVSPGPPSAPEVANEANHSPSPPPSPTESTGTRSGADAFLAFIDYPMPLRDGEFMGVASALVQEHGKSLVALSKEAACEALIQRHLKTHGRFPAELKRLKQSWHERDSETVQQSENPPDTRPFRLIETPFFGKPPEEAAWEEANWNDIAKNGFL